MFLPIVDSFDSVGKETPTRNRSDKERGLYASHGDDPTLASYLSSLFFLLSVPTFIGLAYGGFWYGLYPYSMIVPAFGGLMVVALIIVFGAMHVLTGR